MSLSSLFSKPIEMQHQKLPPWDQAPPLPFPQPSQTTPWYRGQPAERRYGQLTQNNLIIPNLKSEPRPDEKNQHIKNLFLIKILENSSSAIPLQGFSTRCQDQEGMGWTPSNPTRTPAICQLHHCSNTLLFSERQLSVRCPRSVTPSTGTNHVEVPLASDTTRQAAGAWPSAAACQLSFCSTRR